MKLLGAFFTLFIQVIRIIVKFSVVWHAVLLLWYEYHIVHSQYSRIFSNLIMKRLLFQQDLFRGSAAAGLSNRMARGWNSPSCLLQGAHRSGKRDLLIL
jgi:hypothetical protein